MIISPNATGALTLKTKQATVTLTGEVRIGERVLPGAGEYDVAGVQVEAVALQSAYAYLIRSEDILLTYLTAADTTVAGAEGVGDTAVLAIEARGDTTASDIKPIISKLEPSIVVLFGEGASVVSETLGLSVSREFPIKITKQGLSETTTLYVA